jgi:hypothetical protein
MLGGINNELFFQGFGGFFAILIFIPLLRWAFETPRAKAERLKRKEIKKSLAKLKSK